jgi:alpha-N-arabinofuranosidase
MWTSPGAKSNNYLMNPTNFPARMIFPFKATLLGLAISVAAVNLLPAQTTNPVPLLQIKADQVKGFVSPTLYGLMTEEINYSYEGGLYGELIRNRTFKANPTKPVFWDAIGGAGISLDTNQPLNSALAVSLKLDASTATKKSPAGIANGGYWGIPVRPKTNYRVSFYAKTDGAFAGPVTVTITSSDGKKTFASAEVSGVTGDWQKYEVTLKTKKMKPSKDNVFTITTTTPGTIWLQQVSLFPPTYKDRANGDRADLSQLLADEQPKFLRFPGGNYLEGENLKEHYDWKKTVGPLEQRPGHRSPWGYWSTDGFGLPEFLGWCEDLNMEPVLAVFAGYTLNHQHIKPGPDLEPYVQDALDEIEYVTGDTNTTWGAQRARDGHPAPFTLRYVEIGNEDWFDESGSYDGRFTQFYDAIKAKYPQLQCISTVGNEQPEKKRVHSRKPDLLDEHYYRSVNDFERESPIRFEKYDRNGPKIFVGEWAAYEDIQPWNKKSEHLAPTPSFKAALGDAAWMTALERNSDLIVMQCYAPLLVNVNPGGRQWRPNLIGYNALNSYGSPSYYAQEMFSNHHGDQILATDSRDIPADPIPKLFFDATRDSRTGKIILKVVNCLGTPQPVNIQISGVAVAAKGQAVVMKAGSPEETNSIQEPKKVVPVSANADGLGTDFTRTFPPYSITVLELDAK